MVGLTDARHIVQWFAGVRTEADGDRAHRRRMVARGLQQAKLDMPVSALVNHGRWTAECPACGAGMSVVPTWRQGWCFDCGMVSLDVRWPDDIDAIVAVLTARPRLKNRNWQAGETVAGLQAENVAHGLEGHGAAS